MQPKMSLNVKLKSVKTNNKKPYNKALLASGLSSKCSFTLSKLRFLGLRPASTDAASEGRECLHALPSREEEKPPLWWVKIALVIQFLRIIKVGQKVNLFC